VRLHHTVPHGREDLEGPIMTGEAAYAIYAAKMRDVGIVVDPWNEIDGFEQEAWNFMATEVWAAGFEVGKR